MTGKITKVRCDLAVEMTPDERLLLIDVIRIGIRHLPVGCNKTIGTANDFLRILESTP